MTSIRVELLPPYDEAAARLAALARAGENLGGDMLSIAEEIQAAVERAFADQRSPEGEPWAPLEPATLKQREKSGYDGPILQRRRFLLDSIQARADGRQAVVGTKLRYAATHQFGSGGDGRNIPARPFLGVDDIAPRKIRDIVEERWRRAVATGRVG